MNSSYRGTSDEAISAMQTAYHARYSDAMERRIATCREMAEAKIAHIVQTIMTEPVPVICKTTGVCEMMPWSIALEQAWDDGYTFIDIDIKDMKEYAVRQGTDSYPFEDKVNIFTGQYIMDQCFIEPLYIGGAPTLLVALTEELGEQVYPNILVNDEGVRVLRLTVVE
jgi:hypothetical protein